MKDQRHGVSVIIPSLNAATTIIRTLDSLLMQEHPVSEIIIVDNKSTDETVKLISEYAKNHRKILIRCIVRNRNKGVGASYNLGVKEARSQYVIFMHSDSELVSKNEIDKLLVPFRKNSLVVATYSRILMPESLWQTYPFWQKCLSARVVNTENAGLNGKFDCLKRDVFMKIGGFNDREYGHDIGIGAEDADLHIRLAKFGAVEQTDARVIHLHSLNPNYSLTDWISSRKLLARSYGRLLRVQMFHLPIGAVTLLIKPILSILPFMPGLLSIGILLNFIFGIFYMERMYRTNDTLRNPRILFLPFITVFLTYYETFWMAECFFFIKKDEI